MGITYSLVGALTTGSIVLISVIGAIFVGTSTVEIVRYAKKRKKRNEESSREVEDVEIKKGVRYTEDQTIVDKQGDMHLSFGKGDKVLKQGVTYVAEQKGELLPGKYTILSVHQDEEAFNVRIGTYVKEYKHGQDVVIADGQTITPVSTDIILR